jgi:very-short-patch-repair endonuclease
VLGRGWVHASQPIGILQKCWAAALTYPDSVIIGASALAAWHELDQNLMPEMPLGDGPVWLATPSGRRPQPGVVVRQVPATPTDEWNSKGLPLADPFQSVTDALATLPVPQADALFAWLASRRLIRSYALDRAVEAYRNRSGRRQLQKYRTYLESGATSELELRLHLLLNNAKLHGWTANTPVRVDGKIVASADVLFEKKKVIIEVDGFATHNSERAFGRDRERFRILQAAGYQVLPFTWHDIVDQPDQTLAMIMAALR